MRKPEDGTAAEGQGGARWGDPWARLGADVVGVDAARPSIETAARHAAEGELRLDYRHGSAEALVAAGERYDVVIAMEIVEHVADLDGFLAACCGLLRPGGMIVLATLNRTPQAFALAIVGAEYLLRWLAPGTHDGRKFVRPAEMARRLRAGGAAVAATAGVLCHPVDAGWRPSRDLPGH